MKKLLIAMMALAVGCGERQGGAAVRRPAEGGKLILMSMSDSSLYNHFDEKTQSWTGLEIEIVRAAAEKLGLSLEIRQSEFQELLPAVKSGDADLAVSTIAITPARARDVAFSSPYANGGCAFLYRTGEAAPVIPVKSRNYRIGTMMSTTCQFFLCYHDVDPYCYGDCKAALAEMKKGKLDAIFYDAETLHEAARASEGKFSVTPPVYRENYGVAVRKDFPALLEAVNLAIAERRSK